MTRTVGVIRGSKKLFFRRSIRRRTTQENLSTVGERDVTTVGPIRAVLCAIAVGDDLCSNGKRIFSEAAPEQGIGRAAFDHPADDLSVLAFDSDMNPGVGI